MEPNVTTPEVPHTYYFQFTTALQVKYYHFPIYKHEETESERKSFAQMLTASKWSIKDSLTGQTDSKSGLFFIMSSVRNVKS